MFRNTGQPGRGWWEEVWPEPEETLRELGLSEGDVVGDICCGDGHFSVAAARVAYEVYCVEIEEDLLETAGERVESEGLDNVELLHGDARDLEGLLPDRVDFLLLANAFHGVEDKVGMALRVFNALRPGGRFAVINWYDRAREETRVLGEPRGPPKDLRMTPEETRAAVESVPFGSSRTVDLPPHHYAVVFERQDL